MNMETIIKNDAFELYYHTDSKIIHHKIIKWLTEDESRTLLKRGLKELQAHSAAKWLSDDRGSGALNPEGEEWAHKVWLPQVIAAGWKFWAITLPNRLIGQMNIRRNISFFEEKGITVKIFSDPNNAMKWLEKQ